MDAIWNFVADPAAQLGALLATVVLSIFSGYLRDGISYLLAKVSATVKRKRQDRKEFAEFHLSFLLRHPELIALEALMSIIFLILSMSVYFLALAGPIVFRSSDLPQTGLLAEYPSLAIALRVFSFVLSIAGLGLVGFATIHTTFTMRVLFTYKEKVAQRFHRRLKILEQALEQKDALSSKPTPALRGPSRRSTKKRKQQ